MRALARQHLATIARPGVDYVDCWHDTISCDWQDLVTGLTKAVRYLHHKLPDQDPEHHDETDIRTASTLVRVCLTSLIQLYQFCVSPLLDELPPFAKLFALCKRCVKHAWPLARIILALKRILRCHPWAEPMVDPVPSTLKKSTPAIKAKG